jgi:hypothetical protein
MISCKPSPNPMNALCNEENDSDYLLFAYHIDRSMGYIPCLSTERTGLLAGTVHTCLGVFKNLDVSLLEITNRACIS